MGRRCRLLDLKDGCYTDGRLDFERVKRFYEKVNEYKTDGFEVSVYEMILENMMNKLEEKISEYEHEELKC